jgi:dimethylamine/trimethylamine dehydrogenase
LARDPIYDVLFTPLPVGPKVLKNRFYQVPHCTSFGTEYAASQAVFRSVKAEGGWAAVTLEYCSISPYSDAHPRVSARLWDDDDVSSLTVVCDEVHKHGALAGIELWYGSLARNLESRLPGRGAGSLAHPLYCDHSASRMTRAEIKEVQLLYGKAARRALEAGFDLITIYGSHGLAITQDFLMTQTNNRTDEYGGSFENRARFWRECIETVRSVVDGACGVVVRLCLDTLNSSDGGMTLEEDAIPFIELVDDMVDLWDVDVGASATENASIGSSRFFPENWQREWVQKVRRHTRKPVVGVGRFSDPKVMVDAIESGQIDLIGAARPSIADPFLPRKIEEGRFDDIRACIGTNICIARFSMGARLVCSQNPTAGEEFRRGWHPERVDPTPRSERQILVIGAGPAGMECALTLGRRGYRRVRLVDSSPEMGGNLRWMTRLDGLKDWDRVTDYRRKQITKLANVEFTPGLEMGANDVRSSGADVVVLATGARWATDGQNAYTRKPIPGADASEPHVLTPEQILADGKDVQGNSILVYDCEGYVLGAGLAERLVTMGKTVTLVTPHSQIASYTAFTQEIGYFNRLLRSLGVTLVREHLLTSVGEGVVGARGLFDEDEVEWRVDGTVLVTQRQADDGLYLELADDPESLERFGIASLHRIGDCVSPRLLADVVFEGHRVAREIDGSRMDTPEGYLREQKVLPRATSLTSPAA